MLPRELPVSNRPRALITCVGMDDYLALTLPYNRHHFDEVWVVTSLEDTRTTAIADKCHAKHYPTDAFHVGGPFNKYAAIEEALAMTGREGWLCLLDCDVAIPRGAQWDFEPGYLYGPRRRMGSAVRAPRIDCPACSGSGVVDTTDKTNVTWRTFDPCPERCYGTTLPQESSWHCHKLHHLHSNPKWHNHISGYCQIFHASDKHLPQPPWHPLHLPDAGTGDTMFQDLWNTSVGDCRRRPSWEVLHIGDDARRNWRGRTTPRISTSTS